jgi:multiple sugar transport system substrate-binding protein
LTCVWAEILADAGGSILDPAGQKSQLDSPEASRALRFLHGLIEGGVTPAVVTDYRETDARQLFMSGQVAFMRAWNSAYAWTSSTRASPDVREHVGVAPLPTFGDRPGPGHSAVGGWSLLINPRSQKIDAVKTFIRWMTDVSAQRILARYYNIPVNSEVRRDVAVLENPTISVGLASTPVLRPSNVPTYPEISRTVYSNINEVLAGTKGIEPALREAHEEINALLR